MPAKDSTRNDGLQPLGSSLPWVRAIGGKQFPQPLQLEARQSCRTYLQTLKHSAWHHLYPLCWESTWNNRKHVDYAAQTIEPTTLMLHMPWRQILTSSRWGFQWYPRSQDLYSKSTVKQCVLSYREAASIPDPSKSHSKTDCNCSRHLNRTGYWRTTSFDLAILSAKAVAVGRCAHLCLLIGLSRIQYLKQTFTSWSQTVSANIHWKPFGETLLAKGGGKLWKLFLHHNRASVERIHYYPHCFLKIFDNLMPELWALEEAQALKGLLCHINQFVTIQSFLCGQDWNQDFLSVSSILIHKRTVVAKIESNLPSQKKLDPRDWLCISHDTVPCNLYHTI